MAKFENAGFDVDEAGTRYENPRIQATYDWACEWLCDCKAAARICDQCDAYGSTVVSVTADGYPHHHATRAMGSQQYDTAARPRVFGTVL